MSAIHCAQQILIYDPLHELAYQHLIRLHALNNNRAAALRVYHVCETNFQRELNVKPSIATREAYENLLGDESQFLLSQSTMAFLPVVGREMEWAQMLQCWHAALANQGPKFLILCGEGGIGKTRLLEEMIQWAIHQGITNINTGCYPAEGELAYAPLINWLRALAIPHLEDAWLVEISRLIPDILLQRRDLPKPGVMTEDWQREHLFEALARAVLGVRQPLLLTIDNLQWCDRDTLQWIHFLLRFDKTSRILILGTYRPEEISTNHPLNALIQTLSVEDGIVEMILSPLNKKSTESLASSILGRELTEELSTYIFSQSEGNPLYIIEMLRSGIPINELQENQQTKIFSADSKPDETNLPLKVQSIFKARIGQLSQSSLDLARYAATIGREFNVSLLVKASNLDENELVNGIDELWRRRIVREQGLDSYDFSHDKLREVVYESMSASRRCFLHRQVAEALEAMHCQNLTPVSHQLALHFEKAALPERAISYYLQAAEIAHNVYANQEAKILIQRGLGLVEKNRSLQEQLAEVVESLWEFLGDMHILSADYEEALEAYRKAHKCILPHAKVDQARIYRKIAETFREERRYLDTLESCKQAEAMLGKQPVEDINRWWDEWIDVQIEKVWAYYWLAQWHELEALVERISLVVKVRASGVSRMRFLMASCLMNLRKFRYVVSNEMLDNSQESLSLSQRIGNTQDQIECQFELGFLYLWRHEHKFAEEHLLISFELARNAGNILFQMLCLTYLGVLDRFRGQIESVLSYTSQVDQIAEVAHMPDYTAAAKANMSWIAWRKGDFVAAVRLSQQALDIWRESPLVYPCQWLALWPLVGVALTQGNENEAWSYVELLLSETQQRFPEALDILIEEAAEHHIKGNHLDAHNRLEKAVSIARKLGYL